MRWVKIVVTISLRGLVANLLDMTTQEPHMIETIVLQCACISLEDYQLNAFTNIVLPPLLEPTNALEKIFPPW